ncbi:hypothetical protein [Kordia sp.]|uniref:hypothetical protein n=1 Tax=Kordia sp. TaxID=1965332 RepID=UPI0025C64602|nr:hypothetical protein [Kordia sp.]MCH2194190.1 hypothetical protein [Kordia sp.]
MLDPPGEQPLDGQPLVAGGQLLVGQLYTVKFKNDTSLHVLNCVQVTFRSHCGLHVSNNDKSTGPHKNLDPPTIWPC